MARRGDDLRHFLAVRGGASKGSKKRLYLRRVSDS